MGNLTASNESDKIPLSALANSVPMADDTTKVVTSHAAMTADLTVLGLANTYSDEHGTKLWVSGSLKAGAFPYTSKATTTSGSATFYLTDDGTSTGNAVFNNIYADTINVVIYGNSASYQPFNPVVAGNKKSITISANQTTNILVLSLVFVAASNGTDVRLLVWGD